MPADFGYINARVKGMRSRLLPPGRLEEMLALPTLDDFMQALTTTPYGPDLQEALSRRAGIQAVDEALARNFQQITRKILNFADGQPRTLIELVLLRWDTANVLAILRGKHTARGAEEITANLIPAGGLRDVALRDLAGQADVAGVAGALTALAHPFSTPLAEGIRAYQETNDLLELELRLERYYAEHVLSAAGGSDHSAQVVRLVVQAELDVTNVKTALKLQRQERLSGEDRARFFIPGGMVTSEDLFVALADPQTAERGWRALYARGFPRLPATDDLLEIEKTLDLYVLRESAKLYLGDPLAIDVVIGYLSMKYNEVVNLRLIARGKLLGIPREMVRREMALV
ncbi:MAG: V-type ATPase subunit [Armatimonadetes bacterium]|nr:V-type ATPase subunit [Armatimonadota bacterium]